MIDSTKPIDDATPLDDTSGLKLSKNKSYTLKEIYIKEAENIADATIKYLSAIPTKKEAPFTYDWFLNLHIEMFGNVWDWAGKPRKIENRKKQININIENLAKLSHLGVRTVNRFFAGDDVKLSTIERITNLLGLDFAGNEVVPLKELEKQRAKEKALFMASLVQSTSALEVQGLEKDSLNKIITKFEKEFLQGQYKNRLWIA